MTERQQVIGDCVIFHENEVMGHYVHARIKHPHFLDRLDATYRAMSLDLNTARRILQDAEREHYVNWIHVLGCELAEINDAVLHGNDVQFISECYDSIAVLLRMIDVKQGRQRIGKDDEDA